MVESGRGQQSIFRLQGIGTSGHIRRPEHHDHDFTEWRSRVRIHSSKIYYLFVRRVTSKVSLLHVFYFIFPGIFGGPTVPPD